MANFFFGKITDKIDPNQLPGGYYEADSKSQYLVNYTFNRLKINELH